MQKTGIASQPEPHQYHHYLPSFRARSSPLVLPRVMRLDRTERHLLQFMWILQNIHRLALFALVVRPIITLAVQVTQFALITTAYISRVWTAVLHHLHHLALLLLDLALVLLHLGQLLIFPVHGSDAQSREILLQEFLKVRQLVLIRTVGAAVIVNHKLVSLGILRR